MDNDSGFWMLDSGNASSLHTFSSAREKITLKNRYFVLTCRPF
jgi:hypothetical protein